MFIQLNLDEMFDVETASEKPHSKWRSPPLSVVSEDVEQTKIPKSKAPKYQLDSEKIFKESVASSIHNQPSEATFPSTQALPSHYEMPGERLYYEHRHNMVRKMKDLQRWKYELSQQEKDVLTFTPKINKNTEKILSYRQDNPQNLMKAKQRKIEKIIEFEESEKLKSFQELKQCTFRPKIAKKTEQLTRNRSQNVFTNLYRESRMKEIRQKCKQEQPEPPKDPNAPEMINSFLNRNEQFLEKVRRKQEMLEKKSQQFDLSTGEKLFTPKITKNTPQMEHSKSAAIFNKNPSLHNLSNKLKEKYEESQKMSMQQREQGFQDQQQQLFEDDDDMSEKVRKMISLKAPSSYEGALE